MSNQTTMTKYKTMTISDRLCMLKQMGIKSTEVPNKLKQKIYGNMSLKKAFSHGTYWVFSRRPTEQARLARQKHAPANDVFPSVNQPTKYIKLMEYLKKNLLVSNTTNAICW